MKKVLYFLIPCLLGSLLFTSCEKDDDSFDEKLLIGTWQSGTLFYKYNADKTGGTWDTSDDVQEDEAQPFTWNLRKDELEQLHIMEMGGVVPRIYTVTRLSSTTLRYEDTFGKQYSFNKVAK